MAGATTRADRRDAPWWAFVALFALALLPVLLTPMLPLIDFYNHMARYYVLSHLDTVPVLRSYYEARWTILPNIGLDVIGTGLFHVLPGSLVPHVIAALMLATQYAGALYLNRALTGRWQPLAALLAVPLLYSYILNWGFANFLFGLGLAMLAAGWWVRNRERPTRAMLVGVPAALLIFFTHGVAFALYGLLVGALEVGFFLERRGLRPALLARNLGLLVMQAVLPAVMFVLAPTSRVKGGLTNADEAVARLEKSGRLLDRLWSLAQHRFETIARVAEGPSLWWDIALLLATLGVLAWLARRGGLRFRAPVWPAVALGALLVLVCPPALFGSGYVADRMPLFLAFVAVAGVSVANAPARARDITHGLAALSALVLVRLVAIGADWTSYTRDYREFERVAALIPPGSLVTDVIVGGSRRDNPDPRCTMYRPVLVAEHGQIAPLFANPTQQPLRLTGRLRATVERSPEPSLELHPPPSVADDFIAGAAPAGYTHLIVCGAERLTRPLPPGTTVLARGPRFLLLRLADQPQPQR